MNIKSEKIRKKVAIMSLSLLMASGGICSNVFYQPTASATEVQESAQSQESIDLGKFDASSKTFKYAKGEASFTGVAQVVIYCPASNISNLNKLGTDFASGYSKKDDISTPNSTVINVPEGKTASDVATDLLSKLEFSIPSGGEAKDYTVKVNLNKVAETNKTVYSEKTGHIYELAKFEKWKDKGSGFGKDVTWLDAYNAAKVSKKYGHQGYLATITSESENNIIKSMDDKNGTHFRHWIGATIVGYKGEDGKYFYNYDSDTLETDTYATSGLYAPVFKPEKGGTALNYWYWADGPERGQKIIEIKESGQVINLLDFDPYRDIKNFKGGGKNYYLMLDRDEKTSGNVFWNSYMISYDAKWTPSGYIVEYGGIENSDKYEDGNTITSVSTVPAYKMQWTFEKTANTITAKYDTSIEGYYGEKDADKSNIKSFTLSVNAPSIYYTGKVYDASKIELKNNKGTSYKDFDALKSESKSEVKYLSEKGEELASAPKEIGNYTIALTLKPEGTADPSDTLKVNFRILPSPVYIPDGFGKEEIPANITPADIDKVRVAGADRIDTAINISKAFYQKADNVVVANAWNFPDALSASVLANILKAPILLNGQKTLDTRVNAEITRLGVKDAVVVGGENSIAKAVQNSLNGFDKNGTQRISGDNRYATSAKIAEEIFKATKKSDTVVIASGENFADSLSAAGFASKNGYPILLVKKNAVPSEITNVLKKYNVKNTIIVGGTGSVSDQVAKEIKAIAPNQERIAGKDRYDTSVQVAKLKMADTDKAFIASGKNFADALVVGAIAGANNQSVILVSDKGDNKAAKDYLKANIKKVNVIGGEDTVPTSLVIDLLK